MNWKVPAFMSAALLSCTSLLTAASTPPSQISAAKNQVVRAPAVTATALKDAPARVAPGRPDVNLRKLEVPVQQQSPVRTDYVIGGPPPNDDCKDATVVIPPYPVTVYGSNQNATIDCPGLLDWHSTWWLIELPYELNDLHIDMCGNGFEINNTGIIIMDDCECDDYVTYSGIDWYGCPYGTVAPHIWWDEIAGPSYWYFPVYFNNGAMIPYRLNIDVVEVEPCDVECPPEGVPEGEPICHDGYEDTYNGGCGSSPYVFQPINCGDTICGTSGVFGSYRTTYRDTDWFEVETTEPMSLTWSVVAEFPVLIFVINGSSGNCIDYSILSSGTAGECEQVSLTESVAPGLYWFWIGPSDWGPYPCGVEYVATLTCGPVTGACCDDDTGECEDDVLMDDCPPPRRFACDTLCEDLSPPCGGCPETTIDIEILTDDYPGETTWEVIEFYHGMIVCAGGPYDQANTLYNECCCIGYNDCVNFTIYDSYGNGINAPGGYTIWLDGELIYSCMGQGWCCTFERVEMIGDGCIPQPSACCVDQVCVGNMWEFQCDALGGRWYEWESCPDFVCPESLADFLVEAPYEGPMRNTCGEGDDCTMHSGEDHTYEVIIPNDGTWTFSLCGSEYDTYMYVGTTLCGQEVGYNDDYCGLQSQLTATITAGDYFVDIEGYAAQCGEYLLNVWEEIPCDIECPPEGTPEGEPVCYDDYEDTYNAGCGSILDVFQPITCNETMCGTSGTFYFGGSSYRDTDWFEIELDSATNVTWTVCAEFEVLIFVMDGGSGNCVDYTILGNAVGGPFQAATLSYDVGPGRYWFWVGPTAFGSGVPCGSEYVGTLTVDPNVCCVADIDGDGDTDLSDLAALLAAYGSVPGDPNWNPAADLDGDDDVDLADLALLLGDYGCGG